ncbi:MAG: signal transduction histidine kinase [Bacteroidia bacterium]|jgi:signal transduction histidine kinase
MLVFNLLTRRLARLTNEVVSFAEADFETSTNTDLEQASTLTDNGDEISQLHGAFAGMANKIREQFEGLKETDRLRRELVSNVSHDLRTPLASMHGYVETLLIKNDTLTADERKHYLQITRKHTLRLRQLIGDLFELSKLDAASVHPVLEMFSFSELLQDVTQDFDLEAQKKGVNMEVIAKPEASLVYADIGLMQRVLENLL